MLRRRWRWVMCLVALLVTCTSCAESDEGPVHVEAHEYTFPERHHASPPPPDMDIEIHSTDISGNMLRDKIIRPTESQASSSAVETHVAHETSASISAPNKPAHVPFVPVSSTSLGLVDIPDAIVLTPDQVRSAALVVQAILLGGVIAAAVVGSITYVVRSRRAVDESIERVHRLVDVAAIRRAIDTSTTAEFHAAATLRLRVLTFRSNVDAVVADSTQKDFDADRWVVVNRATKAVEPTDVAALLARLSVAIDEGDDLLRELAAHDRPAFKSIQEAIASHVKTLRVRHDHISELKATILDKLHQAIRSSQRNGLQLDDWTRLKELWVALGLPQADVVAPHGWYQTILRDLEAKDAMLRQLAELKQAVMLPLLSTWTENKDDDEGGVVVAVDTPSVALRDMNMLLKEAKANQWSHPEFDQLERFVLHTHNQTQQQHTMVLASSVAPLSPPAMLRTCGHHRGGARDDGRSAEDIGRDLAMHDERMKLDFMIHREKLYFDKINTDRILQQQLDIHMKTLEESQRQFHLQARDNREREERMYQRKLDDATKKLERKQAEKRQLVADQAAKDAATATAKFLALRVHAEWKLVKRVLGINVVVVALVAALVCWDAVTSRELLSATCDVRTSYWTPTHLSVIGCQIMYGAKVGLAMVSGLVFVSICSYLNLSLWGVSILVATALYIFRASWQHVVWRLPHVLWLGMFNYTVGYLLAHDTRHSWSVQHINWRPVVVYIGYPVVSLVVALVVGMWIACDVPVECFHAAVAWCAAHISSLYE